MALGALLETWGIRRRDVTLSSLTRKGFRTHTRTGRIAFVASWWALTVWLIPHLLNPKGSS